jgi:hypothetical protein
MSPAFTEGFQALPALTLAPGGGEEEGLEQGSHLAILGNLAFF